MHSRIDIGAIIRHLNGKALDFLHDCVSFGADSTIAEARVALSASLFCCEMVLIK